MKRAILLAVVAAILAAPAFAVPWDNGDPLAEMRVALADASQAIPTPPSAPAPIDLTPGRFQFYVLALSWQPTFCATEIGRTKPECADLTADRFAASNLVLHGLWPSLQDDPKHAYAYCGVDPAVKALDKWTTRDQIPPLPLSDELYARLKVHMPSIGSSIEKHEWYAHGSCSGLPPQRYFEIADGLVLRFQASSAGRFLSAQVGQTIDSDILLAEFDKDFGAGSRASVHLYCDKDTARLAELKVVLKDSGDLDHGFEGMLTTAPVDEQGICPRNIEVLAPAAP